MRSPTVKPARLGLLWFGVQAVWGALLGISLQARSSQLGGAHAIASYGVIATAGAIVAAITQVVVGPLADRHRARGSRRTEFYVAGVAVSVVGIVWFYGAAQFAQLIGGFMLLQFGMNVATGPYQSVIPDYVAPERTGSASSWMAVLQSIGNAVGAIVASLVADLRAVAALLVALLVATCAATISHVRTLPLRPVASKPLHVTRAFVDLFVSRALIYVGFYTLLGYLFFYVAQSLGPSARASATATSGVTFLIFLVAAAIGAALCASPADRFDRRTVVTISGAIFVAGLLGFLLGHGVTWAIVAVSVAGLGWGAFLTADWALGCAILPKDALATAFGVWNLALIAPQILAPAFTSGVLGSLHALDAPWAPRFAFGCAAIEVCAGILWVWRLPAQRAGV